MEEIKLKAMPDGTVRIEVKGVLGPECMELTKFLEEELGVVVERIKTTEYYARQYVKQPSKTWEKEKLT